MPSSESSTNLVKFVNCRVLACDSDDEGQDLYDGEVTIDVSKGIIVNVIKLDENRPSKKEEKKSEDLDGIFSFDCNGNILAPGFIDLQLNGAFGVDFSVTNTVSDSSLKKVSQQLLSHGVTSYCPTLISCEPSTYRTILPVFAKQVKMQKSSNQPQPSSSSFSPPPHISRPQARILGVHLEGPFFEPSKRGAHPLPCILDPIDGISTVEKVYGKEFLYNDDDLDEPGSSGLTRIITLAPERPGALSAIRELTGNQMNPNSPKIVVSCGHSNATFKQGQEAVQNGASLITHLFNAMRPFHHREPGFLGLLSDNTIKERPYYSIIADGIHAHPMAVKMAHSLHPKGAILVTDAMSAMGLGDGLHTLGQHMQVLITDGVGGKKATIVGTETLAGSVASMDTCVKKFQKFTGCTIGEAIRAATVRPSQILQWQQGGKVKKGCVADLILLDYDLNILECWVGGAKVSKERV